MKDRTTKITLSGVEYEIYCDSAAMMRLEEAGGNFTEVESKPMTTISAFIAGNLVGDTPYKSRADVMNALSGLDELTAATEVMQEVITGSTFFAPSGEKKSGETGQAEGSGPKA